MFFGGNELLLIGDDIMLVYGSLIYFINYDINENNGIIICNYTI